MAAAATAAMAVTGRVAADEDSSTPMATDETRQR